MSLLKMIQKKERLSQKYDLRFDSKGPVLREDIVFVLEYPVCPKLRLLLKIKTNQKGTFFSSSVYTPRTTPASHGL